MNARRTYATYFGFLVVVLVVVGYSARNVIFRPWTVRSWVTVATLDHRIYLFGGKNSQNELMQDILEVDPAANTLKRVGKQPFGLFGCGAATLDGRIFVAGGTDNKSISDRLDRFDPPTRRFTTIGRLPGPRTFGALVASGGGLYYLGGWDGSKTSDEIIRIDPATGTGTVVGHLPEPLEEFAAVGYQGIVYLIGGMDAAGDFVDTIYGIDPATGHVTATGTLPEADARMSATALGNYIYIAGGWNGKEQQDLLRFEAKRGKLDPGGVIHLDFSALDTSLAAIGSQLYLIGGQEQRFRRQVQVLRIDPSTFDVRSILLKSYAWW